MNIITVSLRFRFAQFAEAIKEAAFVVEEFTWYHERAAFAIWTAFVLSLVTVLYLAAA